MKLKEDALIRINFLDHCKSDKKLMDCSVVGWVQSFDKEKIVITTWIVHTDCKETKKSNVETYTIARKLITKIKFLR